MNIDYTKMNIKPLIVKSYLESLTEENELNRIFPLLLTSLGYEVLSKPTENKGLVEYGKDVVAVGKDYEDGIFKRFYFEIKGGEDRDVTKATFYKDYGIQQSLTEANEVKFSTNYKNFEKLPKKIILVHNGELKGNIREVFEGFVNRIFPLNGQVEFDRWGIERLSYLFAEYLFGAFLLTDQKNTKLFNSVLINLNVDNNISKDFYELIYNILNKDAWEGKKGKIKRKWKLLFESLKLISFIIYTESKEYNNFDISKRYLTYIILQFWYWILKNNLESDKRVILYFNQVLEFYLRVLSEYFIRTLPIASVKYGLSSESTGSYEQIGYTFRTFEYLQYLCFLINTDLTLGKEDEMFKTVLISVINANSVSFRPLIDINSVPIADVINLLIRFGDKESAIRYIKSVVSYIIYGKESYGRMPDASNNYESVIRFIVTGKKPIYYSDSTSLLLGMLIEYSVILNMEDIYLRIRDFVVENDIVLGLFIPHHGINSTSKKYIEFPENDLEEHLFSNPNFRDGYQREINVVKMIGDEKLNFDEFKTSFFNNTKEFEYEYRTDKAGFSYLRNLAHIFNEIPYFPDKWRF